MGSDKGLGEHILRFTPRKLTFHWSQNFADFRSSVWIVLLITLEKYSPILAKKWTEILQRLPEYVEPGDWTNTIKGVKEHHSSAESNHM